MKKIGLILCAGFCFSFAPKQLVAQSNDPNEVFLKAYMTSQQAEKLEHDNQFQAALSKFRFAGSMLEDLRKNNKDWQPAIVDFRARKIAESIQRVQSKLGSQKDLAATSTPSSESTGEPILPDKSGPPEPSVGGSLGSLSKKKDTQVVIEPAEQSSPETFSSYVREAAIKEATKKLQDKVDQLEAELQKSKSQYDTVAKEKESLNGRLQEANTKLEKAQADLEKTKGAEKEVRGQLAQAEESLKKISAAPDSSKAQEALRAEIAQLKKVLASATEGRAAAEKEKADLGDKLRETKTERNALVEDLKNAKQAQEKVQVLVAENSNLKEKLATAEKAVKELSADKPKKEQEMVEVKRQIEQLRSQLAASQKQNKEYEVTVAELRSQLEEAGSALQKAKLTGANAEETARLTKENDMLRKIVVRERQEEARRDQARKLMLAEFDKLQIKSETLTQQIELLAQPVTRLTSDELALLRQPVVSVSDTGSFTASFTAARNPGAGPSVQTGPNPQVPDDLMMIAREAKSNFDRGKYRAAEKQYQEILTKVPNNLYSLSNLGVVYFRTGKLKAAELTLKKAVALAPKDEFSHTTLGIVYYRQSKYDEAVTELTKALAINPRSATAHNYLGITASQKGWQEAAEKEMLDAIAVNPDYAEAHFNLAVVYATNEPPAREQAKVHYKKATSLGAEPDAALEKLLLR